jgi:hypothetical protein
MGRARHSEACLSGAEEGEGEGRREEKEKEKRKRKWEKKMKKEKKKKGKREREETERNSRCADCGVDRVQRSHVLADKATGKGVEVLEIGQLEQRKIPGNRVQGFRRILSSMMKSF